MSEADRRRWDERYRELGMAPVDRADSNPGPPVFAHVEHLLPRAGRALEIACGRGQGVAWLARRGMEVWAVDVSGEAIELTRRLVEAYGVASRCHLQVWDLDGGLPDTPEMDLILCYLFRDPRLDRALTDRLAPGGVLAIATLSEVGAGPGRFRARPGELEEAFGHLEIMEAGEADGTAWAVARRRQRS
ncbi:MAG: class I SAM-dependent methyltransferase [Actinomycetota bacterium]